MNTDTFIIIALGIFAIIYFVIKIRSVNGDIRKMEEISRKIEEEANKPKEGRDE